MIISVTRARSVAHGEETPLAGDALQRPRAAVLELDPRSHDEVFHRARDQDLVRRSGGHDPSRQGACDPADVVAAQLHLAGVQPGPDLDAEPPPDFLADLAGAADRARRAVERREDAVSRRLDAPAAKP